MYKGGSIVIIVARGVYSHHCCYRTIVPADPVSVHVLTKILSSNQKEPFFKYKKTGFNFFLHIVHHVRMGTCPQG